MSIYDILFDMNAVPKKNPDAKQSRTAAQFIRYASRSIEWAAAKYVREYNRIHQYEQAMDWDALPVLTEEQETERLEKAERMAAIHSEVARMKKAEQTVFTCLYQLNWSVAQTARGMGCSESYVYRLQRVLIQKLANALKGGGPIAYHRGTAIFGKKQR